MLQDQPSRKAVNTQQWLLTTVLELQDQPSRKAVNTGLMTNRKAYIHSKTNLAERLLIQVVVDIEHRGSNSKTNLAERLLIHILDSIIERLFSPRPT